MFIFYMEYIEFQLCVIGAPNMWIVQNVWNVQNMWNVCNVISGDFSDGVANM